LLKKCQNLNVNIIRPGFIWNKEHRGWSVPLKYYCDGLYWYNDKIMKKLPLHDKIDFLFPAKST
jgi:ABC-type glycerol-3-phosphate transport system substrate-binding protein